MTCVAEAAAAESLSRPPAKFGAVARAAGKRKKKKTERRKTKKVALFLTEWLSLFFEHCDLKPLA